MLLIQMSEASIVSWKCKVYDEWLDEKLQVYATWFFLRLFNFNMRAENVLFRSSALTKLCYFIICSMCTGLKCMRKFLNSRSPLYRHIITCNFYFYIFCVKNRLQALIAIRPG